MKKGNFNRAIFYGLLFVAVMFSLSIFMAFNDIDSGEINGEPKQTQSSQRSLQQKLDTEPSQWPIDRLTHQKTVVNYLIEYRELPDYYVNKKTALLAGWNARSGNLCDVLPGKAIGGDRFGNREGLLPNKQGRIWYEADINYQCGHRGADRLIYSNDGLIYVTANHYKSFRQLRGDHE